MQEVRVRIAWAQLNGAANLPRGTLQIPIQKQVHPGENNMSQAEAVVEGKSLQRELLRAGIHLAGWGVPPPTQAEQAGGMTSEPEGEIRRPDGDLPEDLKRFSDAFSAEPVQLRAGFQICLDDLRCDLPGGKRGWHNGRFRPQSPDHTRSYRPGSIALSAEHRGQLQMPWDGTYPAGSPIATIKPEFRSSGLWYVREAISENGALLRSDRNRGCRSGGVVGPGGPPQAWRPAPHGR